MKRAFAIAGLIVALAGHVCAQDETGNGDAAVLRGLDRVSGLVNDVTVPQGATVQIGSLVLTMDECRYPLDNPAGDAYAHLKITQADSDDVVFNGWMVASSPALNPLEHSRYDVWVLRCAIAKTSEQ
jgi:hypothetical protein